MSCGCGQCWVGVRAGPAGQTSGHDDDRPLDHRLVMLRQPFVVADRAAIAAEPGEGPLDDPAARQHLEGVRQAPTDQLDTQAQGGPRPDDQPASVGGIGPHQADAAAAKAQPPQSGRAPSRSWTLAAVTTIANSSPRVSTARWRFRPLIFLAASKPRLCLGTVSAARTDWESMIAALGQGLRPATRRTWARSWSCTMVVAPLAFQR